MQRLEFSGAVRPIYGSLGVKRLKCHKNLKRVLGVFSEDHVHAYPKYIVCPDSLSRVGETS